MVSLSNCATCRTNRQKFSYVIHVWGVELGEFEIAYPQLIHNSSHQCRAHSGSPQIVGLKSVSHTVVLGFTWKFNACCTFHTHIQWTIIWKSKHWIVSHFLLLKILIRTFCFNIFTTLWRTDSGFSFWDCVVLGLKYFWIPPSNDAKQTGEFGHKFLTINTTPFSL